MEKEGFFVDDFNEDLIIGNCDSPMFCLCYASHHDDNHDGILREIRLIFEPTVCQYWRLLVILVATIDGTGRALCLKDLQFEVNRLQLMWGRQVAKTRHKLSHFCSSWALALAVMDGVG